MAAFVFVHSPHGSTGFLSEDQRLKARRALQERQPGEIREHAFPGGWAAVSGSLGGLSVSGNRLLLWDGDLGADRADPLGLPDGSEGCAACAFDGEEGEIRLIRDRFGVRPLFWTFHDDLWMVASESKVFQALGVPFAIEPRALQEAFAYRWVTGESCLLSPGVRVPEGTVVSIRPGQAPDLDRYWRFTIDPEPMDGSAFKRYQDATDQAIRSYLRRLDTGDAPVGVLLSGGVDSSLLTALAKEELGECFAYGFRIQGWPNPELDRARVVANHLGIPLREVPIDPDLFPADLPYLMRRMEEFPRHPNNLVLLQLLRAAAGEVKVMLQGDAADTLFSIGTRRRIRQFNQKKDLVRWLPRWLNVGAVKTLEAIPMGLAWRGARILAWDEWRFFQARDAIEYGHHVRRILGLSLLAESRWDSGDWSREQDLDELRRANLVSSGIQGSLIRHDRLSRPEGIDSRAPFISPEVVEVARTMPRELCYGEVSKPVLRALCDRYLPQEVSRWPKGRFEVPWGEWLFGPLRPLCQEAGRALEGTPYVPPGFMKTALDTRDREGAWSGLALHLLLEEFGLQEGQA